MSRLLAWIAACAVLLASIPLARAASGDLDGSFGTCGIVITDIGSGGKLEALALQPDGKIIAVGSHLVGPTDHGAPFTTNIVVLRYNDDGTLDGSFGSGGIVVTDRGPYTFEDGRSVVLQPDGKIVVAGAAAMVRYNDDGTLDTGFGTNGIVSDVWANDLVLQPDGKLVTAGQTSSGDDDFQVARYDDQGNLDGTFGTGGIVTTDIGGPLDKAFALVLQADGKLVAAGYTHDPSNRSSVLVRYEDDGDLDGTFGSGGTVVESLAPLNDELFDLVLQPDDKLVAAGNNFDFMVARFDSLGALDAGFGMGGVATTPSGQGANALALQSTNIIAVGGNGNQVMVVAHDSAGALVPTFGSGGIVTTQVSTGAYTNDLVIQSDGKLVVGGGTFPGKAFVARYFGTEGTIGDPAGPCPTATPSLTPTPTLTATPTPTPVCAAEPLIGCRKPTRPEKSKIQLKNRAPDDKDTILWKWNSGAATTKAEFVDPTMGTDYALCIYDRSGGVPVRVLSASIPSNIASGSCDGKPCWKEVTRGYKYSDRLATPDGIRTVLLREGADGYAKIKVKGKGFDLDMPSLPLVQNPMVTVQLIQDGGLCWDTDYSAPATKNISSDFKDTSD